MMRLYVGKEPREIIISSNGYHLSIKKFLKPTSNVPQGQHGSVVTMKKLSDEEVSNTEKYTEIKCRLFQGLFGIYSLEGNLFVGVISGVQKIGFPKWRLDGEKVISTENIFKVLDVDFFSLDSAIFDYLLTEISEQNSEKLIHEHPCGPLKKMLSDGTFYFSRDYDLSNSVKNHSSSHNMTYIIDNQDQNYIWNRSLNTELITWRDRLPVELKDVFDKGSFLTFLIRGYCKTLMVEGTQNLSSITVISRISTESMPEIFGWKGLNEEGKVTDLIETEVIVSSETHVYSFKQVCGNVPLFWEVADSQLLYGKKVKLTKELDNSQVAFDCHFDNLASKYGVVSIVNVVKPRSESQDYLDSCYNKCAVIKGIKYTNISYGSETLTNAPHKLIFILEQDIYELGAYIYDISKGIWIGKQTGVLRISAFDSLKKTNLVEKNISKTILESVTKETTSFDLSGAFLDIHDRLWKENYYWLDRTYSQNMKNLSKYRKIYTKLFNSKIKLYDPLNSYIVKHLKQLKSKFSTEKNITIFAGTFNTGGKIAEESITDWIFPKNSNLESTADIYLIGLEEVVELTPNHMVTSDPYIKQFWEKKLLQILNGSSNDKKYVSVWNSQLGGVLSLFFLSESEYLKVKHIEGDVKKTGFGGMASNKGAVAVSFNYSATKFCVIVSHLAAGLDNIEQRHSDYKTIVKNIAFSKGLKIKDHDAIIWMGDFNYRILMSNDEVRKLIQLNEFITLFQKDQLNQQMVAGSSFPYYNEMEITFPPTYKFDPGTKIYDTSEKMRIPAWTDRILSRGEMLQQLSYGCAEDILFSDHRPVYATFKARVTVVDEHKKQVLSKELYEKINMKLSGLNENDKLAYMLENISLHDSLDVKNKVGSELSLNSLNREKKRGNKLPPPSSDLSKWWIGAGKQAKVVLDIDTSSYILNPKRGSNPFTKEDDEPLLLPK